MRVRKKSFLMPTGIKGVYYNEKQGAKPWYIVKTIDKKLKSFYFATKDEAVQARKEDLDAKDAVKRQKEEERQALRPKREHDVKISGNTCEMEREATVAFCAAAGGDDVALVLNDGTRADVLFRRAEDAYLQLQWKTTATTMKGENGYHFTKVLGYAGMLVVFWVVDLQKAWVFDGTWLDERGKAHYYLTPGGKKSELLALQKSLSMDELVAYLKHTALAPHFKLTTEEAARRDFKGADHAKEKVSIDEWEELTPGNYSWPCAQNGKYDRLQTLENGQHVRIQHKHCRPHGTKAGLFCRHLGVCDGTDHNGKKLFKCYEKDDADLYVFRWRDEAQNKSHFWAIPADVLAEHGYFTNKTGKESIYLYGPEGVGKQPNPNARKKADTWTRAVYVGFLNTARADDNGDETCMKRQALRFA